MNVHESYLILFFSALLSVFAYFGAWSFFWSGFEWSPWGYETCGLEGLVWIFAIPELMFISYLLKIWLVISYEYSKSILIYPLIIAIIFGLTFDDKSLWLGYASMVFLFVELIFSIYAGIDFKRKDA